MLKIKHLQLNGLGIGIICSVISATITPAAAGSVIIINNAVRINQPPAVGSFIYGSPISTPMPVDPRTGLIFPRGGDGRDYHSYPVVSPNGSSNSGLINPTLINPVIRDSSPSHPVIFHNNSRTTTPARMNRHRVRSTGRSGLIFNYPR